MCGIVHELSDIAGLSKDGIIRQIERVNAVVGIGTPVPTDVVIHQTILFIRICIPGCVDHRRDAAGARSIENHVVVCRIVPGTNAQDRFCPVDAVGAFGIQNITAVVIGIINAKRVIPHPVARKTFVGHHRAVNVSDVLLPQLCRSQNRVAGVFLEGMIRSRDADLFGYGGVIDEELPRASEVI